MSTTLVLTGLCLATSAAAQHATLPLVRPTALHEFVTPGVLNHPDGIVALADGTALVTSNGFSATDGPPRIGRVRSDGTASLLHRFTTRQSILPKLVTRDGSTFWGASRDGGPARLGTVFRLRLDGTFAEVYAFTGGEDGNYPRDIFAGLDGALYVVTSAPIPSPVESYSRVLRIAPDDTVTPNAFGFVADIVAVSADSTAFALRIDPDSNYVEGIISRSPSGVISRLPHPNVNVLSLAITGDGTLVGVGWQLGTCVAFRYRPAFEVLPNLAGIDSCQALIWQRDGATGEVVGFRERTLLRFSADATLNTVVRVTEPYTAATSLPDGTFWFAERSTSSGCGQPYIAGRVRALAAGVLTTIVEFSSSAADGVPQRLVVGADGIYGTLRSETDGGSGAGAIFFLGRDGSYRVLHRFACDANGFSPAALLRTAAGDVYGVTQLGVGHGGTVFRIGAGGVLATLFVFQRASDGQFPTALADGADGSVYGLTLAGGNSNRGTFFRLTPAGDFTVLRQLTSQLDPLVMAGDNQFYAVDGVGACQVSLFRCFGRMTQLTRAGEALTFPSVALLQSPAALTAGGDRRLYGINYVGNPFTFTTAGELALVGSSFSPMLTATHGEGVLGMLSGPEQTFARLTGTTVTPIARLVEGTSFSSLVDGGDGYLYGISTTSSVPVSIAISRFPRSGLDAPTGVRILR